MLKIVHYLRKYRGMLQLSNLPSCYVQFDLQTHMEWTDPGNILSLYYGRLLWLFPSQVGKGQPPPGSRPLAFCPLIRSLRYDPLGILLAAVFSLSLHCALVLWQFSFL